MLRIPVLSAVMALFSCIWEPYVLMSALLIAFLLRGGSPSVPLLPWYDLLGWGGTN
jgi:hypothetical protein